MSNCIFCKIVNKEIPSFIVGEDEKCLAFLDIRPINKGHVLVVPKEHYPTLLDIPDALLRELMVFVKKITKAVSGSLETEHINIFQRNGQLAGQAVPHIHFHVLPRFPGDGHHEWDGKQVYNEGEGETYRDRIKMMVKI
ncbi:MAG: HIT family protein [Parcubacteria group bacterium]|nr:HIT family protein [Parcubacteria group bacterium]